MPRSMKVAVTDANIFIDIIQLEFTEFLFSIDLEIHTTHIVLNELNPIQKLALGPYISSGKLVVIQYNSKQFIDLANFDLPKGLSIQDKSILVVAKNSFSLVLSGDIKLRNCCKNLGLHVHGILWLFDQFLQHEKICHSIAIEKMQTLLDFNKWLPFTDCQARIDLWSNYSSN